MSAVAIAPAARKRLGLVALAYAYRALVGLLVAAPLAAAVDGPVALYPRGQAELFDPGGVMLLESVRHLRRSATPLVISASSIAIVAALFGLFPLAVLIAGLGREGKLGGRFLVGRAWDHAGTLALVWGLGLAAQAALGALVVLLGGKLVDAFHLVPPGEDLAFAGLVALALAGVVIVGVIRDVAWVAAMHQGERFYGSVARALECARRRPARLLGAYTRWGACGLVAVGAAAVLAPSLEGARTWAILVAIALHQAGIFAAVFARASWLAAAIRMADAERPAAEPASADQ